MKAQDGKLREMHTLDTKGINLLVSQFLDCAELQALELKPTSTGI